MPSYERWWHIKNIMEEDNIEELRGAIKNALEHRQDITKVKQTFINAGYEPKKVEQATKNIFPQPQPKLQSTLRKILPSELKPKQAPPQPQTPEPQSQFQEQIPLQSQDQPKKSKTMIIILIIISVIVLIGAALLGLFWDSIF